MLAPKLQKEVAVGQVSNDEWVTDWLDRIINATLKSEMEHGNEAVRLE